MKPGFIVYAMPRSRTAWMSKFLSYGGWSCWHEQAIFMRKIEDFQTILSWPRIGTVETAMAPGWRLLHHYSPSVNCVVVKRPIPEVVESMMATDLKGIATYERNSLTRILEYGDRMLDDVSQNVPGCLTLDFADLSTEAGCKTLFEHCLPFKFDPEWWEERQAENVQVDVANYVRYYHENKPDIEGFKKLCWRELRRLRMSGEITKH